MEQYRVQLDLSFDGDTQHIIPQQTKKDAIDPRPPLENSWQDASIGVVYIFISTMLKLLIFKRSKK